MKPGQRPGPDPGFINGLVICMLGVALGFAIYWFFR